MITVITGTPGAGKTALAVSMLADLVEASQKSGAVLRPVVVMGIPELQLPHEVAPPIDEWTEKLPAPEDPTLLEAHFTFPEGALVIIDEAQKVYRPRATGSKVPDHVAAFERHRHKGLDFWLITQHPGLLDANVRKLAGKHIHLRDLWAGRQLYEWSECKDPESRAERDTAIQRRYKLPARIFGLYKSASMHIKQRRRLPWQLYAVGAAVAVAGYLGWGVFERISGAIGGDTVEQVAQVAAQGSPLQPEALPGQLHAQRLGVDFTAAKVAPGATVEDWHPRIATRPETAPMYDGFRQVRALPIVAGCVAMRDRCQCYTDQGTDAYLTGDQCREWLRSPPFNPWREPQQAAPPRPAAPSAAAAAESAPG